MIEKSYMDYEYEGMNRRQKEYLYGMRLRGYSPGCQPMEGLLRVALVAVSITIY